MLENTKNPALWDDYLRRLAGPEGPLSTERAEQVRALWTSLMKMVGPNLWPPNAGPLENDGFGMSWDKGGHHFEIEVSPLGTYGWFYMDRDSGVRQGDEEQPLGVVSPPLVSTLRRIVAS